MPGMDQVNPNTQVTQQIEFQMTFFIIVSLFHDSMPLKKALVDVPAGHHSSLRLKVVQHERKKIVYNSHLTKENND